MTFKEFGYIFIHAKDMSSYELVKTLVFEISGFNVDNLHVNSDTISRYLTRDNNFKTVARKIKDSINHKGFVKFLDDNYSERTMKSKLIDGFKNYNVEINNINWKSIITNMFVEIINRDGTDNRRKSNVVINLEKTIGWTNYCNWSNRSINETEYIIKDDSIIYKDNFHNKKSLIDGINLIRKDLLDSGNSVRLAGLSGTGKTRLAQALFDQKIGHDALDKSIVIYGDIGDGLKPEPIEFIQQLIKEKRRVILIVDNCDASMHNRLTKLCQIQGSNVSLMTIEYDVKEDDNIDSNNYYLGPATNETLRELLKRDYSYIDNCNIDTIVKYSDGNYRIAIYLARTIDKKENIGILNDNNLLERLFYQGGQKDNEMMKVGEVCSLFYSFNINYEDKDYNEMNIISKISGLSIEKVCFYIEELQQKQIIQKRGDMRAVLPHILANRLASDYLNHYLANTIVDIIGCNNRLLKSFFRRIKNLHDNKTALILAEDYLNSLSDNDLINANDILIEILRCINIMHPFKMLCRVNKIEDTTFFTRDNKNFYEWVLMLAYSAYDEELFLTATGLIVRFALAEEPGNNYNSIRDVLSNMFHIYLSGTHAPLKVRLEVIDELITSEDNNEQELGLSLLDNILEYGRSFIGSPIRDSGAKIRDYGLIPVPIEWFNEAFEYIDSLLNSNILYDEVREVVASNFVTLYRYGYGDILDSLVRKQIKKKNWPIIWTALLAIKRFDKDEIPEKYLNMINDLIELVKPCYTKERLETYLYGGRRAYLGLDIAYNDFEEANKMVYQLGVEVGCKGKEINEYLSLINNEYDLFRIDNLTKGIYDTFENTEELIYLVLEIINNNNDRALKMMLNYLMKLYHNDNSEACDELLDKVLLNKKYNKYFIVLQLSYNLDDKSLERIENAIDQNLIDDNEIFRVESIINTLNSKQIISLLDKIKIKTKNGNVIIDTLYRLSEQNLLTEELKKYARKKLIELDFKEYNKNGHRMHTYTLSELIKKSFVDDKGMIEAKTIFEKIRDLSNEGNISYYDLRDILEPLISMYPYLFLDVFINFKGEPPYYIKHFFKGFSGLSDNIINHIDCSIVIEWLKNNNKDLEISYLLEPYKVGKDNYYVWNNLALYLFETYTSIEVINNIVGNIYPTSWENDYSDVMKRRYNLILSLKESEDKNIKKIGKRKLEEYQISLQWHLERERKEHEEGFGRFED